MRTNLPACVEGLTKYALKPVQYNGGREIFFVKMERLKEILMLAEKMCNKGLDEARERGVGDIPLSYGPLESSTQLNQTTEQFLRKLSRKARDGSDKEWCVIFG
jgi:hypothetical protein